MYKTKLAVILPLAILLCAFSCHGQVTVGGANVPVINAGPPQNGQVGVLYTFTASASGGTPPYTWSTVPSPAITGVGAINASTGVMTGTPTTGGTYNFNLKVVDGAGQQANAPFTVQISNALTITSGAPPNGVAGVAYGPFTFTASGGTVPYSWSLASGSLPSGVTLNGSTGALSGSPVGVGTSLFSVKVTDAVGAVALAPPVGQFTVVVTGSAPTCGPPTFPCSSRSALVIQVPSAPFVGTTGVNTIACDPSINGACSGVSGVDPIVRATDSTTSSSSCTVTPSGSSSDNLWATDHSKVAITCGNGNFVLFFNGATMQITGQSLVIPNSGGGMEFSRVNPNVLYTLQQANGSSGHAGAIWKVTFTGGTAFTQTLFFDPITAPGAGCATLVGKTFTSTILSGDSADANFEAIEVTSGQQSVGWVAHYDITNNNCEVLDTNTGIVTLENGTTGAATGDATLCWPIGVHAGRIFKDGLAGGFATAAIGACINAPHLWTYGTRTVRRCNGGPSNTCGPNHDFDGYNVRVISPTVTGQGGNAQLYFYTELGTLPPPLGQYYGTIPSQDDEHFTSFGSGVNLDLNPLVGETVKLAWTGTPFTAPGEDEIFAMPRSPLTSAPFIRFAHHFASSVNLCSTCDFRTLNAIGSTSQDGQFMIFVSDMRLGLGTDSKGNPRQDLFIVRLD